MTDAPEYGTDTDALDKIIAHMEAVQAKVLRRSNDVLVDTPWPTFIREMRVLSAQAWGPRAESWLRAHHGWEKVAPQLARGDARSADVYREMKVSILTPSNRRANFVQIRPHHAVNTYELFVVEHDYTLVHLRLTKAQMTGELTVSGTLAHGTSAQQAANDTHAEYALRVSRSPADPVRQRLAQDEVSRGTTGEACCCPQLPRPRNQHLF